MLVRMLEYAHAQKSPTVCPPTVPGMGVPGSNLPSLITRLRILVPTNVYMPLATTIASAALRRSSSPASPSKGSTRYPPCASTTEALSSTAKSTGTSGFCRLPRQPLMRSATPRRSAAAAPWFFLRSGGRGVLRDGGVPRPLL